MATGIAALASGINGAASGTAEFYKRGTTTPLMVYSDPEGTVPLGKTVTLDANGGAEVYTAEPTFVRVRSYVGTVVRQFTVVVGDSAVDARSTSFTGLLPSGSQGAGGAVDAQTLLNRWYASAGALDWKVRRTGQSVDETLVTALSNVAASNLPFFNVKTYGAVGDGATNDDAAFLAAYTAAVAAGGGIVFIPAGNYVLYSTFSITSQQVSLMGAGCRASIITSAMAAGTAVTLNAGASTFSGQFIQDLQIIANSAGANVTPLQVISTPGVVLRNLMVKDFALPVDIQSRTIVLGCDFTVPSSATAGSYVVTFTGSADDSLVLGGTFTQSRATNTGAIKLSRPRCCVRNAKVDISAASGAAYGVDVDAADCRVEDCNLVTGAAASVGIRHNADVNFAELANVFSGSGTLFAIFGALTTTPTILRGSRLGKIKVTSTITPGNRPVDTECEFNEFVYTGASGGTNISFLTDTVRAIQIGARFVLRLVNNSGSTLTTQIQLNGAAAGNGGLVVDANVSIATGKIRHFEFVYKDFSGVVTSGRWYLAASNAADVPI